MENPLFIFFSVLLLGTIGYIFALPLGVVLLPLVILSFYIPKRFEKLDKIDAVLLGALWGFVAFWIVRSALSEMGINLYYQITVSFLCGAWGGWMVYPLWMNLPVRPKKEPWEKSVWSDDESLEGKDEKH